LNIRLSSGKFFIVFLFFLEIGGTYAWTYQGEKETIGIIIESVPAGKVVFCRSCGNVFQGGKVHPEGPSIIENVLRNHLFSRNRIPEACSEGTPKCIYVLLYRFQERIGGDYSVEKPASVGFHMHLLENMTVKKSFTFDEEQKPVLHNLLGIGKFLKRRGKWIDATSLSEEGIKKGLEELLERPD
jgi:hypothetical protein